MEIQNYNKNYTITYRFYIHDKYINEFKLGFDDSFEIIKTKNAKYSDWTKLKNFKCPNCPSQANEEDHCNLATNLEEIINFFSNFPSFETAIVEVETSERKYEKKASLQTGVSSIIGIIMATSGCPIMGKLKPMARFHLPFSSLTETAYRVSSMYMLAQYFRIMKGEKPDLQMENLPKIYKEIEELNRSVCSHIADLEIMDTSINSLIILNNFAEYVTVVLDEDKLHELEFLFKDYLE